MIVLYVTTIKYLTRDTIYILFTKFKILYDTGTTKIFLYVLVKKKSKKGFFTYLHFPYIHVYTCQTMSRTQRKKDQDEVPPKPHIDCDPVMTTRFCFDSKNEDLKREARN